MFEFYSPLRRTRRNFTEVFSRWWKPVFLVISNTRRMGGQLLNLKGLDSLHGAWSSQLPYSSLGTWILAKDQFIRIVLVYMIVLLGLFIFQIPIVVSL